MSGRKKIKMSGGAFIGFKVQHVVQIKIDSHARELNLSRSEFCRLAIEEKLDCSKEILQQRKRENENMILLQMMNTINNNVLALSADSIKRAPYYFICLDKETATLIMNNYKQQFMVSVMAEDKIENWTANSPYNYRFIVMTCIPIRRKLSNCIIINLNPNISDIEKLQRIKAALG